MPHYKVDNGLENLGKSVINTHRKGLHVLKIAYVFRPEAVVSNGHVTYGMCVRLDDRNWTLHGYDFLIEIAKDVWEEAPNENFKLAIMDHELGHIRINYDEGGAVVRDEASGRIKTSCRKHDIEEFEEIMERHGAYHKALRDFISAYGRSKEALKKVKKREAGDEEPVTD